MEESKEERKGILVRWVKEGDESRKGGEECQLGRRRFRPKSKGGDLGRRKVRRRRGRGEEKSSCQDGCLDGTEL